jgi:ABC-type Zn uptake system ZnuABC Zn-binding protein ZnuA
MPTLRRVHAFASVALLAVTLLAALGCASCKRGGEASGRARVAVSIFPLWDLARRVGGDRLDVVLVLPPGRSEHSYDPTPKEMARLSGAKLGIEVGLDMDTWLEKVVKGAAGDGVPFVQVGPKASPLPMGKEALGDEAADEARKEGEEEHHHGAMDPHVWLDPTRMAAAVEVIVEAFAKLDPEGSAGFRQRGEEVKRSLAALDARTMARTKAFTRRSFGTFHGSFGYYAKRYGLVIAAVIEPFPGREPTPKYVQQVLEGIKETKPAALFSEPQLDKRPAQVIAEQAKIPLFELDPVGGGAETDTYEKLLDWNTGALEKAMK